MGPEIKIRLHPPVNLQDTLTQLPQLKVALLKSGFELSDPEQLEKRDTQIFCFVRKSVDSAGNGHKTQDWFELEIRPNPKTDKTVLCVPATDIGKQFLKTLALAFNVNNIFPGENLPEDFLQKIAYPTGSRWVMTIKGYQAIKTVKSSTDAISITRL